MKEGVPEGGGQMGTWHARQGRGAGSPHRRIRARNASRRRHPALEHGLAAGVETVGAAIVCLGSEVGCGFRRGAALRFFTPGRGLVSRSGTEKGAGERREIGNREKRGEHTHGG